MGFIGADGKFYGGTPRVAPMVYQRSPIWKQADHDRQRADHKRDLIRPYQPNGEANPDFVEEYPDESKETYNFIPTDEQIAADERDH